MRRRGFPARAPRIVVIGAGIGGLTAAALLADEGYTVTVLEAGTYPGGSAGTFFHQGFRYEAGATLAGGFQPGRTPCAGWGTSGHRMACASG
jgi:phytoene dehydrogenase-like protein